MRLRSIAPGAGRRLELHFRIDHAARVDAVLLRSGPDRCLTAFCRVRLLRSTRVRAGSRTLTYRLPAGQLAAGGRYVLRVAARSAGRRARADVALLRVPAEPRPRI